MNEDELLAILALQAAPGVGDRTAKKLIAFCGSPQAVFTVSKRELYSIEGIGSYVAQALSNDSLFKQAENELSFIRKNNIQYHYFEDASYPFALKHCVDGPILASMLSGRLAGSALTRSFRLFFRNTPPLFLTPGAVPLKITGMSMLTSLSSKS